MVSLETLLKGQSDTGTILHLRSVLSKALNEIVQHLNGLHPHHMITFSLLSIKKILSMVHLI